MYDVQKSFQAASVEEALMLMSQNPGAVIVCGGTDVMIRMKERKLRDAILISILNIPQLCGVQKDENGDLLIGPGTCFDDIYRSECVRKTVPCLAEACNTAYRHHRRKYLQWRRQRGQRSGVAGVKCRAYADQPGQ